MGCSIHTAAHPVGIKGLKSVWRHNILIFVIWISSLKYFSFLYGRVGGVFTKAKRSVLSFYSGESLSSSLKYLFVSPPPNPQPFANLS